MNTLLMHLLILGSLLLSINTTLPIKSNNEIPYFLNNDSTVQEDLRNQLNIQTQRADAALDLLAKIEEENNKTINACLRSDKELQLIQKKNQIKDAIEQCTDYALRSWNIALSARGPSAIALSGGDSILDFDLSNLIDSENDTQIELESIRKLYLNASKKIRVRLIRDLKIFTKNNESSSELLNTQKPHTKPIKEYLNSHENTNERKLFEELTSEKIKINYWHPSLKAVCFLSGLLLLVGAAYVVDNYYQTKKSEKNLAPLHTSSNQ